MSEWSPEVIDTVAARIWTAIVKAEGDEEVMPPWTKLITLETTRARSMAAIVRDLALTGLNLTISLSVLAWKTELQKTNEGKLN